MQNYNNNELKMIYYKFHIYYAKQFWKCGNPFLKRARGGVILDSVNMQILRLHSFFTQEQYSGEKKSSGICLFFVYFSRKLTLYKMKKYVRGKNAEFCSKIPRNKQILIEFIFRSNSRFWQFFLIRCCLFASSSIKSSAHFFHKKFLVFSDVQEQFLFSNCVIVNFRW